MKTTDDVRSEIIKAEVAIEMAMKELRDKNPDFKFELSIHETPVGCSTLFSIEVSASLKR
jgi:hypothetical protein